MKKFLLLCLVFAIAMLGTKAQIGGGFNFAMNFGGGGYKVQTTSVDASNNTYFLAQVAGVAKFAGQNVGAVSTGSFPILTSFIGKISADGTQTLIRSFSKYPPVEGKFSPDGDFYGFFKGDKNTPVNLGDNILLDDWGLYLVKFNSTGVVQFFKKIAIGVAPLSAYPVVAVNGMQVAADGNLYFGVSLNNNGDAQSPYPTAKYPTLVAKYDASGNAVWSNTYYGDNRAYVFMGNQFVSNDGRVTFGISAQSSDPFFLDGVNITPDMSAFITQYGSMLSIVVSLNPDGTKNFSIADGVVAVYFRNVDPFTGKIYLFYSYLVQPNVFDTRRPSKAPFTSLPNQGIGALGSFNGLLSLDNTGAYLGYGNIPTANQTSNTLLVTNNGFVNYYNYSANSSVDYGNGYAFGDANPFSVVAYYDQNFNFLKAVKSSTITSMGANGNNVSFGGMLSSDYTFGNSTLIKNYNDPTFASNTGTYYAAYKNDLYIAQANAANIVAPASVTWLGVDNNWDNAANWSNNKVADISTLVKFSTNTPIMPTTGSTPKAAQVIIDAGVTAQFPSNLIIGNKLIINGKLQINHTGVLNFNGYGSSVMEGTGTLAFNGTGTSSINASNNASFKDLTLEINEDAYFLYPAVFKKLKFTGTNSIIKGNLNALEVTSADEDAISGYSETNYINAGLTRAVNPSGTYVFPGRPGNLNYEPATLTPNNLQGVQKINAEFKGAVGAPNYKFPDGSISNVVLGYSSGSNYSYGNSVKFSADAEPTSGTYDVTLQRSNFNNGVLDANKERYVVLIDGKFEGTKLASTQVGGTINGQTVSNATVTAAQSGLKKFGEFLIAINSAIVPVGTKIASVNWTGAIDGNWNTAGNWSDGVVPNSLTNVTIPTVSTQYPSVYSATDFVNSLTINSGVIDMSLSNVLKTNLGITNNGDIKIVNSVNASTTFYNGILGNGKTRFEANNGLTQVNLGTSNAVEVNIGNTNSIVFAGSFSGSFNVKSGIITSINGSGPFALTSPNPSIQIAAPINGISTDEFIQTVSTTGTYFFPLVSARNQLAIRNYGAVTIKNNGIAAATKYTLKFEKAFKVPVSITDGADFYNDFINSGQWYVTPTAVSATGTVDVSFTTSGYTNGGRTNVSDYVLLRRASNSIYANSIPWVVVSGSTVTENAGTITATANGIPAFNSIGVTFCIGIKRSTTIWLGTTSTDWNTASNWSNGVPTETVKAVIANAARYPSSPPASGTAASVIEISSGTTLSWPSTFSAPGGIVNNGTLNVVGTGTFFGFGPSDVYGNYANISGSGKLVFNSTSPTKFDSRNMGNRLDNSIELNNSAGLQLLSGITITGNINLVNGIFHSSSSYPITMSDPDATITGSSTAHINGQLIRRVNTTGTYNFPVGAYDSYNPVSINMTSMPNISYLTIGFLNSTITTQPNLTIGSKPVKTLLPGGSWTITPNPSNVTGNYGVTLSAPIGTSQANDFYILKRPEYSSDAWQNFGLNVSSTITNGIVTASSTGLTGFSQFVIGQGTKTLPVTLVKFSATAESKAAKLYWETASELNNDKFEIERSTNGTDFTKIGQVKGSATSQKINTYTFNDFAPIKGDNYYRLKQVDFNGDFTYSDVKAVNFDFKEATFTVFLNPVTDVVNFSVVLSSVELYNLQGVLVLRQHNPASTLKIPYNLAKGIYLLKGKLANGNVVTKKIIVNN